MELAPRRPVNWLGPSHRLYLAAFMVIYGLVEGGAYALTEGSWHQRALGGLALACGLACLALAVAFLRRPLTPLIIPAGSSPPVQPCPVQPASFAW